MGIFGFWMHHLSTLKFSQKLEKAIEGVLFVAYAMVLIHSFLNTYNSEFIAVFMADPSHRAFKNIFISFSWLQTRSCEYHVAKK